jgi:hypothetical protein
MQIDEIGLDHLGGVAILSADGFTLPIPIAVGMADAAQLFHTAGESRHAALSTMHHWLLQCITRHVCWPAPLTR